MYYNLVLSGGAIQGLTFIGAIKYFEEKGISKYLNNILGSSSGSIIALALSVNYSADELCDFIKQYFIVDKNSINNITTKCILTFIRDFGLDDGKNVIRIVESLLENKNLDKDITFSDISKQFGKNLIISASNLTTGKIEYFDVNNSYNEFFPVYEFFPSLVNKTRTKLVPATKFVPAFFRVHFLPSTLRCPSLSFQLF